MTHIFDLMKKPTAGGDPKPRYFAELEALSAEGWRREFGSP
jgi:hypothetical protein